MRTTFAKSKLKGFKRIKSAFINSIRGFRFAFDSEAAIKQEFFLIVVLIIIASLVAKSVDSFIILVFPLFVLLAVELLNTAIEVLSDRVTSEYCEYIKNVKDVASASVFVILFFISVQWLYLFCGMMF